MAEKIHKTVTEAKEMAQNNKKVTGKNTPARQAKKLIAKTNKEQKAAASALVKKTANKLEIRSSAKIDESL